MIENCMASRLTFHLAEQLLNGEALSKKELAIELNISYTTIIIQTQVYRRKKS